MDYNYVTEQNAQRKWYSKVATRINAGSTRPGHKNGLVLVRDRASGEVVEENMPSYLRFGMRMLYQTQISEKGIFLRYPFFHDDSIGFGSYSKPAA